ncbi:tetratricopeptide repeat protein [Peterkaempfera sp. SMS 1(5)a]|uniref:tetratricopeptide repeat protein n=1 Tax=Peterkaempfera podocarpi TaxID=3232308 RepID=UPI003671D881
MWSHLDADPDDEYLPGVLAAALIEAGDGDGVRRLADRLTAAGRPADAAWTRARWAEAEGRWSDVAEECASIIAADPTRINTRRLWARAAAELGDHAAVQRLYEEILRHALPDADATPEEAHRTVQGSDLWGLVVAATANRDWAAVRAAAGRLGMEFDTAEGPIDEEWQVVTVRAVTAGGSHVDLPAIRTGPATARIVPVTGDDVPVNHGDTVVFEPSLLEPRPESEEELSNWRPLFGMVTLLDPAGFTTYWIDGARPGQEAWITLRDTLREQGYGVWVYSGDGYRVTDPAGGEPLPGVYAAVGVPPRSSAAEADSLLARLTAAWPHPLAWVDLAKAAGQDPAPHLATVERYGL